METKFKVGDILESVVFNKGRILKVIDVVFEKREIKGNWISGKKIKFIENGYVFFNPKKNWLTYSKFENCHFYVLSQLEDTTTISIAKSNNKCPRCNEELKEKFSEYTNSTILKCPKCNWC